MSDRRRPDKPIGPKEQITADDSTSEVVEGVFKFAVPQDEFTAPGDVAGVHVATTDEVIPKLTLADEPDAGRVFPKLTLADEPDAGRVFPKLSLASEADADTVSPKMHLDIRSDDGAVMKEMLLDRLDDVDDQKLDGLDLDAIVSPRDPASGLPTGKLLDHDGAGVTADHNEVIEGVFKFAVPIDEPAGADASHLGDAGGGANWQIEHGWPAKVEMDGALDAVASDPDNLDNLVDTTDAGLSPDDLNLPDAPTHTYEEIVFTLDADDPSDYQAMPELDANAHDGLGAVDVSDDDGFDALDG